MENLDNSSYIMSDQVSETKLIASLVLFLITLICGYLPVRVILNQNYVQHAMFAGGGVLMATAFCHLIPEAHDSYKASKLNSTQHHHGHNHVHADDEQHLTVAQDNKTLAQTNNETTTTTTTTTTTAYHTTGDNDSFSFMAKINGLDVPYLELTLCCGFFFMYLVEQLMLRFIANHSHEHPCDTNKQQATILVTDQASVGMANHQLHEGDAIMISQVEIKHQPDATSQLDYATQTAQHNNHLSGNNLVFVGANTGGDGSSVSSTAGSASVGNLSTTIMTPNAQRFQERKDKGNGATELYKFIRGLLIVSAFGTHSIFDGVAIGSQDSVEKVWTIFIAISCHKLIIAAVVGLELFAATLESHLWTLVHLIVFSIMSPIGIILIVVAQESLHINSEHPSMILLQSFATGTLLYIIFVEILQPKEDQYHAKNRLGKSFSMIAGFALMLTVLTLIHH